jgi:hypothetical protein
MNQAQFLKSMLGLVSDSGGKVPIYQAWGPEFKPKKLKKTEKYAHLKPIRE